ncbi:hypothetical protein EMCRGX_G022510 [Ephydatia muelleri]
MCASQRIYPLLLMKELDTLLKKAKRKPQAKGEEGSSQRRTQLQLELEAQEEMMVVVEEREKPVVQVTVSSKREGRHLMTILRVKRHHMYIHTVEITSQCPTCHKGFTRVDMYWKYLKLTDSDVVYGIDRTYPLRLTQITEIQPLDCVL